jgi:hypothetical protein
MGLTISQWKLFQSQAVFGSSAAAELQAPCFSGNAEKSGCNAVAHKFVKSPDPRD